MNIKQKYELFGSFYIKTLGFKKINFKDLFNSKSKVYSILRSIFFNTNKEINSYEGLLTLANDYGVNTDEFYYDSLNTFIRVYYIYNGFIMDISYGINIDDLFKSISETQTEFDDYFINKKALPKFMFYKMSSIYAPQSINFLAHDMREDDLKDIVKNVQKFNDYNANNLDKDLLKLAYGDTIHLIDDLLDNGLLTVYRGMGSKSNHYEEAYSWTLNKEVAMFFATRAFHNEDKKEDMTVISMKVPIDYIIGVIDDVEEEILVDTDYFEECEVEIEEIDFLKTQAYPMPKKRILHVDKQDEKETLIEETEGGISIHPDLLKFLGEDK